MITALTVNYNTPDHLKRMLTTFRKFYDMPCMVIDGSDEENFKPIKNFEKKYNVTMFHFDHNIHHGPGMAFGIGQINTDRILLIDSDIIFWGGGIVEKMDKKLKDHQYGIGDVQRERNKSVKGGYIRYLHPAFALINRRIALKYPLPELHGAPLFNAMSKIHFNNEHDLIVMSDEVYYDFWEHKKRYVQHNDNNQGMATVSSTGGYHLERKKL